MTGKVRFIWEGKNRHKISFIVNLVSIVLCHICFLCRIGCDRIRERKGTTEILFYGIIKILILKLYYRE